MELFEINITTVKSVMLQYAARATEYIEWLFSKKVRMFELCRIEFSLNCSVILLPVMLVASCGLDWFSVMLTVGAALSILLHEIGHAIGGHLVGNPAKEIGLIACGGYTILTKVPGATARDALISAFGPLANALVVIALVLLETLIFGLTPWKWACILLYQMLGDGPYMGFMPSFFHVINALAIINTYMLLFNLLPAFPLDGGRVFRCITGRFLSPLSAASVTMFVARVLACAIAIRGVITDLVIDRDIFDLIIMILAAVWIWCGSTAEVWRTEQEEASSMEDPSLDAECIFQKKE